MAGLAGVVAAASPRPAHAAFTYAPDVVLFCNPTVAPAFRRCGDLFRWSTGVPVRIIAVADRIFAAQLARGERNDLSVAVEPVANGMQAAGLVDPLQQAGAWRDRLVIARAGDGPIVTPSELPAQLRLGAADRSGNNLVDAGALLDRLGLRQPRVGELDTAGVAELLARGEADVGLVFETDRRAAGLRVAARIPDEAYPTVRYVAVLNKHVLSRYASPFAAFLATRQARAQLAAAGLELQA